MSCFKSQSIGRMEFLKVIWRRPYNIIKLYNSDFELDLFSTQLSRKHSDHRMCGPLRLVRMRKA